MRSCAESCGIWNILVTSLYNVALASQYTVHTDTWFLRPHAWSDECLRMLTRLNSDSLEGLKSAFTVTAAMKCLKQGFTHSHACTSHTSWAERNHTKPLHIFQTSWK